METYIKISNLNDFVFCPKSIFFHNLYEKYNTNSYQTKVQKKWKMNHETIDKKIYSDKKDVLQSLPICSNKYSLHGKIDILDTKNKILIERKSKVSRLYLGYKYQLYAQYFCLIEMWYDIKRIKIYSISDNKNYFLDIPNHTQTEEFEDFLRKIRSFKLNLYKPKSVKKCQNCIYSQLCDVSLLNN